MLTHLLRRSILFLLTAYMFTEGYTSPYTLSTHVKIPPKQIMIWAISPLWSLTIYLLGHRGEHEMKGLTKYKRRRNAHRLEAKRLQVERLDSLKTALRRFRGLLSNDLKRAENIWTEMFTQRRSND